MELAARWTDDAQGKKDYDGPILSISTRYWPRGGGYWVGESGKPLETNEDRPGIKPSAKSELTLSHGDEESLTLMEEDFEAEAEEEVKRAVEAWAKARFDEVVTILANHYPTLKVKTS